MSIRFTLVFLVFLLIGCSENNVEQPKNNLPKHSDFSVGMSQKMIPQKFGEPLYKKTFITNRNHIWGAREKLWYKLPDGTTIDVWSYSSTSNGEKGQTEIYFINGDSTIYSTGFSPEGIVYESVEI